MIVSQGETQPIMADRLGTAQWEQQALVAQRYPFAQGKFWLGRAESSAAVGYRDDRHICLVSGTRAGKGTSIIINNLCSWPGSAIVVDPKGENANVTAARRGRGSEHCEGMGQAVHVLDPFRATQVDERYRSSFNPLDALDPKREETIDEASRLANAIVVVKDDAREPFWDEAARSMVRGLILYVLTARHFRPDERNLVTVRKLILHGEWLVADTIRAQGYDPEKIDPPHLLLWRAMERSTAFDGLVAGIGSRFRAMMKSAEKTYEGILQAVDLQTEFIDSPGMRRVLAKSDFKLSELKTRPEGMTIYMCLPQGFMDTHYRWLRMMVGLTTTEMEKTRGQPATGHPVLMVLDEFAGLKRMSAIESAVAQIAGFGVKLFFVLQSLEQLKNTYKGGWETFLANAGVKIFFSIEDLFTRDYVSKLVGETEIVREVGSSNESQSTTESYADGSSRGETRSRSTTEGTSQSATHGTSLSETRGQSISQTHGTSQSDTHGASYSETHGRSQSVSQSHTSSESFGTNESFGWSRGSSSGSTFSSGPGGGSSTSSYGSTASASGSRGTSHTTSHSNTQGTSYSKSQSETFGRSASHTEGTSLSDTIGTSRSEALGTSSSDTTGTSHADTDGYSETSGTSQTYTEGSSRTRGTGRGETVHRRPLIQPDELGRYFARIDNTTDSAYPGLALVLVSGANPFAVRRTNYFEDAQFIDCFSPHPEHVFHPANRHLVYGLRSLISKIEAAMEGQQLTISAWRIKPGQVIEPGQVAATIENVPPYGRTVHILTPQSGKVLETAGTPDNALVSGTYRIPEGSLLAIKSYSPHGQALDPFRELRQAWFDLEEAARRKAEEERLQAEARRALEEEKARLRADAARRREEEEARQRADAARRREEEEARRRALAEQEAARRKASAEEEARRRQEAERRRLEAERQRRAAIVICMFLIIGFLFIGIHEFISDDPRISAGMAVFTIVLGVSALISLRSRRTPR